MKGNKLAVDQFFAPFNRVQVIAIEADSALNQCNTLSKRYKPMLFIKLRGLSRIILIMSGSANLLPHKSLTIPPHRFNPLCPLRLNRRGLPPEKSPRCFSERFLFNLSSYPERFLFNQKDFYYLTIYEADEVDEAKDFYYLIY